MDFMNFLLYSGNIAVIAVTVLCSPVIIAVIFCLVVFIAVYVGKSLAYHSSLN